VVDLVPSSGQLNIYNSHNNSNPNMKIWETGAKSTSKLPAEKERGESMHGSKKPTKNLKAEARVIQEILDPNMFSAQELSAYYANNPSTVNYVMKGNSNQGGEDVLAIKNQAQSNKKVGMHGTNKNNNRQGAEDAGLGDSSARYESSANHRAGSGGGGHSSTTAVARHKKSMIEFKDTLQSLLKIPKPVLKVLHESCAATAAGDFEKRPASSVLAVPAGVNKATADTSAAVSTASYVWSCGQNSYGELGLGDAVMRKSFSRVSCLDDKRIVSIGAGNEHSLFVTQDGKLLTAGYNDNGQCGIGTTQQVRHPAVISALEGEDISQVHVYNGCEHTLVVTRDGKIFSFGYNYRGQVPTIAVFDVIMLNLSHFSSCCLPQQLGLGSTNSEFTPRPIRGLLSRRVVLAACSYHHSVMLCADGSLYSCGRNDSGQLGHGDLTDKKTPQSVISCPRGIVSISCGQFHTVVATSAGVAYSCGKNDFGQLGIENSSIVKAFAEITAHPEIEQVAQLCCGYYHTLLLSNTGVVAGFGRNDYGQVRRLLPIFLITSLKHPH
jgi:RCC1 and BTB domain-containing protein